jgi:hypothetical protein
MTGAGAVLCCAALCGAVRRALNAKDHISIYYRDSSQERAAQSDTD